MQTKPLLHRLAQDHCTDEIVRALSVLAEDEATQRSRKAAHKALIEFRGLVPMLSRPQSDELSGISMSWIMNEIQYALDKAGLVLTHNTRSLQNAAGEIVGVEVTCIIWHEGAEALRSAFTAPVVFSLSDSTPTATMKSAAAEARRYATINALYLNLEPITPLDVASPVSQRPSTLIAISQKNVLNILREISQSQVSHEQFKQQFRVNRIEDLKASAYEQALAYLRKHPRAVAKHV